MGFFSSVKKGLSKAWGGIKKAVKGVAKGVKKVAKKIVTSTPWGKKLWEAGSKAWKGIKKGIGKVMGALGPVGSIALSFVLAPFVGPAIGALWNGFGAGAAAMATSANAFVSTLGTVGQGIFSAGNFIGGTLGAMGNAISQGASNVMSGNFSAGMKAFASNMSNAFTGKAGMAAVHAGNMAAATTAANNLAMQGGSAAQVNALSARAGDAFGSLQGMGDLGAQTIAGMDPKTLAQASNQVDMVQQNAKNLWEAQQNSSAALETQDAWLDQMSGAPQAQASPLSTPTYNQSMEISSQAMQQAGVSDMGIWRNTTDTLASGNTTFQPREPNVSNDSEWELPDIGGYGAQGGFQPYVPQMIKSQTAGSPYGPQGQGSEGFSLLGGIMGLENSIRNSQRMMFG